jgi:maltose/moltooligosaccharide transporter
MRLDHRKVFHAGLIFFGIALFWQTYDMIVARALIDKFGLNQTWSGLVMALDNIMAVFLLPVFGALSDRSRSRFGRRTPYIVVGTLVAAVAFMGLSFADHQQSLEIGMTDIRTGHYDVAFDEEADLHETAHWVAVVDAMTLERNESLASGRISRNDYALWDDTIREPMTDLLEDAGDTLSTRERAIVQDTYYNYLSSRAWEITASDPVTFIVFTSLLFIALVAMAIYRSPAVALMPDITVKPLRSKANSIVNLMGAFGGLLAVNIIMFSGLNRHSYDEQTFIYVITGVIMVLLLLVYLKNFDERGWTRQKEEDDIRFGIINDDSAMTSVSATRAQRRSLFFLLASVFLWYAGYNAVMTKIADYMPKVLNMDFYEFPFIIAQVAVVVTILPIGLLSMKVERKTMIQIGILMTGLGMLSVFFVGEGQRWLVASIIAFAGAGWAMINVNSYPMVADLSDGSDVGRYTGYYYSAAMLSQIFTPILSGILMDRFGRLVLFPYGAFFILMSFVTMVFVDRSESLSIFRRFRRKRNGTQ